MRIVVTDASGAILRTCAVPDAATAAQQLSGDGTAWYELPGDAGFVDDASLCVVAGVLALRSAPRNPNAQLVGLAVTLGAAPASPGG